MTSSLTSLFKTFQERDCPPIIELQNKARQPVGALYLEHLRWEDIVVSETNNTERFYIYLNGIALFFTYWQLRAESSQIAD